MSKFKVGDRVKTSYHAVGTVISAEGVLLVVSMDNPNLGASVPQFPGKKVLWLHESEFERLPKQSPKIVITTDGTTTLARLYEGNNVIKSAEAICSPADTFDFNVGAQLAFNRLVYGTDYHPAEVAPKPEQPKQEPVKLYCVEDYEPGVWITKGKVYEIDEDGKITFDDGYSTVFENIQKPNSITDPLFPLVSRPARVGEWVLITADSVDGTEKGEICEVVAINIASPDNRPYLRTKERTIFGYPSIEPCTLAKHGDYLVLDGYKPEPEKAEPEHLNMRVVCVEEGFKLAIPLPDLTPGKVYQVSDGVLTDDSGYCYEPYSTLQDICGASGHKFIEFKGE